MMKTLLKALISNHLLCNEGERATKIPYSSPEYPQHETPNILFIIRSLEEACRMMHLRASGIIWRHMGSTESIWGDLGKSWDHLKSGGSPGVICNHLGSSRIIISEIIWDDLGSSRLVWARLRSSFISEICDNLISSGSIWEHLGASVLIRDLLRASGIIWNHVGSSRSTSETI